MPTKHGVYTTQAATGVSTPSVADSGIPFVVGAAPVQSADNYSAAALGLPVLCTSFAEAKAALGYSDDFASYDLCEVMYTHFQLFGCQPVILCNMPSWVWANPPHCSRRLSSTGRKWTRSTSPSI